MSVKSIYEVHHDLFLLFICQDLKGLCNILGHSEMSWLNF
jgi:hypothetical protein